MIPFRPRRDSCPVPCRLCRHRHKRQTTATLLLKARVPMYIVQKILRHADIKTTVGIYGHLDIEDSREALKSMPAARLNESDDTDPDREPPSPSDGRMFHLCSRD